MDLLLFLKSLLEGVLRVVQVSLLILVLLLDIRVDFSILHRLRSYVWIKVLIDHSLQLVEVIDVLDNPVNGILEALDEDVVGSNLCSILLDKVLHMLLSCSELIDDVTKIGVDLVVMSQVLVHIVGLLLQSSDLHASWGNVSLQLLNFVIKDELELLELLGLLFKSIDLLLLVSDHVILLMNLETLLSNVLLKTSFFLLLLSELSLFVNSLTSKEINFSTEIEELSISKLELSL